MGKKNKYSIYSGSKKKIEKDKIFIIQNLAGTEISLVAEEGDY